jgi:hypothetical protein
VSAQPPGGDRLLGRRVPARILAIVTFTVLLVGTVAAFGAVQHLKRTGTIFDRLEVNRKFSPNADGFKDEAMISFRLTRPDRGDVEILDGGDQVVGTLAEDMPLRSYFIHEFSWNGLTAEGEPLPPGLYRIRVRLEEQERTITPATTIELRQPDEGT